MEQVYVDSQLTINWKKESNSRENFGWWFDFDIYNQDMHLHNNIPIICDDGPQTVSDTKKDIRNNLSVVVLQHTSFDIKIIAYIHTETNGLKLVSSADNIFKNNIKKISIEDYAKNGLVTNLKEVIKDYNHYSLVSVLINPIISTLIEHDLIFMIKEVMNKKSEKLIKEIVGDK